METALLMDSVAGRLEDELVKCLTHSPPNDTIQANPRCRSGDIHAVPRSTTQSTGVSRHGCNAAFDGDPAAKGEEIIAIIPSWRPFPCSAWPMCCMLMA